MPDAYADGIPVYEIRDDKPTLAISYVLHDKEGKDITGNIITTNTEANLPETDTEPAFKLKREDAA